MNLDLNENKLDQISNLINDTNYEEFLKEENINELKEAETLKNEINSLQFYIKNSDKLFKAEYDRFFNGFIPLENEFKECKSFDSRYDVLNRIVSYFNNYENKFLEIDFFSYEKIEKVKDYYINLHNQMYNSFHVSNFLKNYENNKLSSNLDIKFDYEMNKLLKLLGKDRKVYYFNPFIVYKTYINRSGEEEIIGKIFFFYLAKFFNTNKDLLKKNKLFLNELCINLVSSEENRKEYQKILYEDIRNFSNKIINNR